MYSITQRHIIHLVVLIFVQAFLSFSNGKSVSLSVRQVMDMHVDHQFLAVEVDVGEQRVAIGHMEWSGGQAVDIVNLNLQKADGQLTMKLLFVGEPEKRVALAKSALQIK